jgi:hypothetical protein
MSKINICTEFCYQPPLTRWAGGWHEYFFKNSVFKKIRFLEANPNENNYLHLFCVPDETILFLEKQDKTFYDQLLKKNFKILFTHEGFNLFSQRGEEFKQDIDINNILYWRILKILEKNNIKEENIYFIHSADGQLKDIQRLKNKIVICKNAPVQIKSKHIQLPLFLTWGQKTAVCVENKIKYHYACLFGNRPAAHRHNLIKSLWLKNLLPNGKCSLNKMPDDTNFSEINIEFDGRTSFYKQMKNYDETYVFQDILLWVTGETYIPSGYPNFTEKTVKAILYERPFIAYGEPGILRYLKSFGFKTFSSYWDESYDDIEDDDIKIEKISLIIKDLCKKDLTEVNNMYASMKPILQHNKKMLQETDWVGKVVDFLI